MTNSMPNCLITLYSYSLILENAGGDIEMRIRNLSFIRVLLNRFRRNDDGATAMEYGLLVALLAIALMLGLNQFYTSLDNTFKRVDEVVTAVDTKTAATQ